MAATILQVYLIFQRYKFKSKSQLIATDAEIFAGVFDISKIQIQKQITTSLLVFPSLSWVYLIFQRYKFKSKSQHARAHSLRVEGVFDISKIQIQKQITTIESLHVFSQWVYLIFQRYKFKSKSQPRTRWRQGSSRCI